MWCWQSTWKTVHLTWPYLVRIGHRHADLSLSRYFHIYYFVFGNKWMNMLQSKYIHLKCMYFPRYNLPRSIIISPIDPIVNQIVCTNSTILLTFSPTCSSCYRSTGHEFLGSGCHPSRHPGSIASTRRSCNLKGITFVWSVLSRMLGHMFFSI